MSDDQFPNELEWYQESARRQYELKREAEERRRKEDERLWKQEYQQKEYAESQRWQAEDQSRLERVQGELLGRWDPAARCRVHRFSRHVGYRKYNRYSKRVVSLHLCGLGLTWFPLAAFEFDALEELHVANNSIRVLSSGVGRLSALRILDLYGNALSELPATLADIPRLQRINVDRNPLVRPPREVIRQGIPAIRAYLRYAPTAPLDERLPGVLPSISAPSTASPITTAPQTQATTPDTTSITVFVSYSKKDQAYAATLTSALQQRGYTVWIDDSRLAPGTPDWERTIRDAVRSCHVVVLVASPNSRESTYVKDELALARASAKPVIPLWAAGDSWVNSIPLGWGQTQYIDGRGHLFTVAIEALARAIHEVGDPS